MGVRRGCKQPRCATSYPRLTGLQLCTFEWMSGGQPHPDHLLGHRTPFSGALSHRPRNQPRPPAPRAPSSQLYATRMGERGARCRGMLIVFCLRLPVFVYTRYDPQPARAVAQNAESRQFRPLSAALAVKIVGELCPITAVIINMLPFSYRYVL